MLQYILECIAFQLVFLIIYDLFLKRETFFQWNRLYLMGTYIISMVLPWIKIEAMKTTVPEYFQSYPEFLWNSKDTAVTATVIEEASFNISWEYALLFVGMLLATELNQPTSYLVAYKKAFAADSIHLKNIFQLGKHFVVTREKANALEYLNKGLAFYPDDVSLINLKALSLFNNDN